MALHNAVESFAYRVLGHLYTPVAIRFWSVPSRYQRIKIKVMISRDTGIGRISERQARTAT